MTKLHQPCPDCGSSDALTIYDDFQTHCFSCGKHTFPREKGERKLDLPSGNKGALLDRKISGDTTAKYRVTHDNKKHYYPYYESNKDGTTGQQCAVKMRILPKESFPQEGDTKKSALFGQNVFPMGSAKYITLTEGECDAMSAYELLGSKYPVVSVKDGSSGAVKNCKKAYKYLDSFERIYLCFDMDDAGQKAAHEVADLFPGKCYLMKLTLKDPNEYLKKSGHQEFTKAFWDATRLTPDSIVSGDQMWSVVSKDDVTEFIPYPWKELNKVTYGLRLDEMVTITAGSGMGKTQVMREMQHFFLKHTEYNIGCLMLEEPLKSAGMGVMSVEANKILHLPSQSLVKRLRETFGNAFDDVHGVDVTEEELREYYNNTLGTGRIHFYDGFGENNVDRLISSIKYMAKALDCKIIFLDHISIIVSEQTNGDERKALDEIATKLKKLTIELNIALIMVSHAKRQATKPLEEGGSTSLSDIRGTAGIGQLSNIVLGLERNGQDADPITRNTTMIRVIKNRFTGLTGPASMLYYERETGRLTEVDEETLDMLREVGENES